MFKNSIFDTFAPHLVPSLLNLSLCFSTHTALSALSLKLPFSLSPSDCRAARLPRTPPNHTASFGLPSATLAAQPNKSNPSSPSPLSYQPCHRRRALTVLPSPRHPRFSLRPPPASLPSSIYLSPTLRAANHAAISQPRRPRCEPPNSSKRQTQAILQPLLPTSSRQPASIQKEQPSRPILLNSLLRSAVLAAAATPASHYTLPSSSPSNTRTRSRPAASRPHSISSHPRVPLLPVTPAKSSCCKQSKHYAHTHTLKHTELTPTSGACDPLCSVDETSSLDFEASYKPTTDLLKALAILAASMTGAVAINQSWVAANQDAAMALLFGIGYAGIIFEESLAFNKSGVGLLMAVSLWVVRRIGAPSTEIAVSELTRASAEVGEIVFFLLGAMTIVEIVDAHQGFKLVTDNITTRKPRTLLWVVGFVTFFLSSVLDNLTSTIIMVSLLQKLVPPSEYRKLLGAVVVIAANAGGAWTPIGDITTTMLWVHGQISTLQTMKDLIIPSAVSLAVPLALMSLTSEVNGKRQDSPNVLASEQMAPRGQLVFSVGIGALLFAPVFKAITGLPPYMGMLLGLGVLWLLTDAIHYGESESQKLRVPHALSRIDIQGVLFFLGILLSVSSLEAAGILRELANYLDAHIANSELIASAIGVVSAIIDNVPLAAATMGMYDLSSYPQDSELWQLVAYCVGTGGSMLVIGSAAGVAFMGMEKVDFFWYLRKVSGFAFAGYAAGIATYLAVHNLPISLPTTLARFPFLSS